MFRRYKKAAQLMCSIAVEMGKPRFAHEAHKQGAFLSVADVYNMRWTIEQRADLAERVEDLVDLISLITISDSDIDEIVSTMSSWYDGSLIPRVARYARNWELRTALIERMFAKPPEQLVDIYDALTRPGLATDRARKFGEQLMRLAIERDDPHMLQLAARSVATREITLEEWKALIRTRIGKGPSVSVEDVIAVAMQAV